MKASEKHRLELLDDIEARSKDVREARKLVEEKAAELRNAKAHLADRQKALAELHDELLDGTPAMPILQAIRANQDAGDDDPKRGELTEVEICLKHSLENLRQSDWKVWHEFNGAMTDAEVWSAIRRIWPAGETFVPALKDGPPRSYAVIGGDTPRFWIDGRRSPSDAPTFEGAALLAKVRDVMDLKYREESVDERLDAALLHVLKDVRFADLFADVILQGMADEQILEALGEWWPERPTHLTFADDPDGEGFTIVGDRDPELCLGRGLDLTRDAAEFLRDDRLAARVRKVLGLSEPEPVLMTLEDDEPTAPAKKPSKPRAKKAAAKK